MEPITAVILIILGVLFVLPMGIALMIRVVSSIFQETNSNISGFSKALLIPALLAMLFRYQVTQEKKEKPDEQPEAPSTDGGVPDARRSNVTPLRSLRDRFRNQ